MLIDISHLITPKRYYCNDLLNKRKNGKRAGYDMRELRKGRRK